MFSRKKEFLEGSAAFQIHKRITLSRTDSCYQGQSGNVFTLQKPLGYSLIISAKYICVLLLLLVVTFVSAASPHYVAPEDCEWMPLGGTDVALTCHLQTINTGKQPTNFTLIQPDHTASFSVVCEPVFFESQMARGSLSHLRFLKTLRIKNCKLPFIPDGAFHGLGELRNLTIRTYNNDWGAFPLEIVHRSFSGLKQLESLDLGYNNIHLLPDAAFCNLHALKVLNLTHNKLQEVVGIGGYDNHTRRACLQELLELDLDNNRIAMLKDGELSMLRSLQVFNLRNNHLTEVSEVSLSGMKKLTTLDMSNNQLAFLPAQLFRQTAEIRQIYLQNNSLSGIPLGLFNDLQQLLVLNISFNQISSDSMNADTFADLIRLVILDLSHNKLQVINSSVFQSQYSLQMLYLDHNQIDVIADNAFSALYNLHTLVLNHNNLHHVDVFTFNGLYVITVLQLANNRIEVVHQDAFKNCSSIQDLKLNGNRLTSVPLSVHSLQFLKTLDLNNNSISNLTNPAFRGLKQLFQLDVSGNNIGNLSRGTFRDLPALTDLNLGSNEIHVLEHGIFDDAAELNFLTLNDNYLTDVNGLFMNLHKLQMLNISRNKITWFDYALIPVELEKLDIHSNEIETLGNYFELESALKLRYLDASFNLLKEINGASFPNRIERLRLNDNSISIINAFTFMSKANLTRANLTNNSLQNLDINAFRLNPIPITIPLPEFSIAGNPYFCDCTMEWLQRINNLDDTRQYPRIDDLHKVMCHMPFSRNTPYMPMSAANSSDFLCKYRSHCFALCHCCEFDACDCEMVCPENCTCYSDQTWNTNIVDCSSRGYLAMPAPIPMDVTDLHLDGNDIYQLTSHTFIGRKNMRIAYLNNSNIQLINNRTFNGLHVLRILHLEHNRLGMLYGYEFETLHHLKELYLSHNHIKSIINITFLNLKSLEILHLDHNLIVDFQVWNLNYNSRLSHAQLSHNIWTCNCQYMEDYHNWLSSYGTYVKDGESIRCYYNKTAGPYLLEFNSSSCSNDTSVTYFQAVFQADYMSVMIIAPILFVILIFALVLVCIYRKEMKVWVFSKYGVRFRRNQLPSETEKLFDVFVSYCKKDEAFVSQILAPGLECGSLPTPYRMCLRYRDLPMAGYVAEAITEAIECSHRTIVVLSEQFLKSEWCRFELKTAHHESQCNRNHRLVIVLLDKVSFKDMDPDAKMCFRSAPIIRWGEKRFWEKLRYSMPDGRGGFPKQIMNGPDPKLTFPHQRLPHSNSIKLV